MLRRYRMAALVFASCVGFPPVLLAQVYPARPVRVIAPMAPGGAADLIARSIAERLGASLGQQFVVDNRPGAAGTIGLETLSRAAPDGYTLGSGSETMTVLPFTQKGVAWDPRTSFAPISLVSTQPLVLAVHASVPATSVAELVAYARARPGRLVFGSSGHGHSQHLTGEMIKRTAGFDMTHVPYKGGGAAIVDLVGGQIPAAVLGSSSVIPYHRSGKVRILAVTAAKRSSVLPDVPTLAEVGVKGIDVSQTLGIYGPAKLPTPLVTRLNAEVARALASPAVRERLESAGFDATPSTPQELGEQVRANFERWGRLIAELGLKFE
jgi:tripartite-type tricarboxylate transporter receptor subunit TctC